MYDSIAHMQDRHRRDVSMLQLWANNATPEDFDELLKQDGRPEATQMEVLWDSDTFSKTSYICARVAAVLGSDINLPFAGIVELIEDQWASVGGVPHFVRQDLDLMNAPGFPHGVTVRFRITRQEERQRNGEHERSMMRMYEDRY